MRSADCRARRFIVDGFWRDNLPSPGLRTRTPSLPARPDRPEGSRNTRTERIFCGIVPLQGSVSRIIFALRPAWGTVGKEIRAPGPDRLHVREWEERSTRSAEPHELSGRLPPRGDRGQVDADAGRGPLHAPVHALVHEHGRKRLRSGLSITHTEAKIKRRSDEIL